MIILFKYFEVPKRFCLYLFLLLVLSIASLFANNAPTISAVADQSVNEDNSTGAIAFTVGDVDNAVGDLTVTGTSGDTTLVPNANVVIGGSGANRTVTVSPAANQNGTATITLTVSDGGAQSQVQFNVTVAEVNDSPTITTVADQSINEDNPTGAIDFTVGDVDNEVGDLTVTGTSGDTTLVPNANVVIGGSGANRTVTVSPAANQNGTATITLTVSDGTLTVTETFNVTVAEVNDFPTITTVAEQSIIEDANTGAISFTVGDVDNVVGDLTVTGTSGDTTLVPNANVVIGGSGANRTVTVSPAANQNGTATITLTVSDGGAQSQVSFNVVVAAVNDAPTITAVADQSINEDNPTGAIDFTVDDVDNVVGDLTVTGTSSNTTLVPNADVVVGGSGANRTVTVSPAANQNGTATITLTVSDGALTVTETFNITVAASNDSPTVTTPNAQSINEDANTGAISFTVGDVETAAGSLTVTGTSGNTTLVPNANVVIGGSGANRTVTVSPAANQNGTATITLTVSDGGAQSQVSFNVVVAAVNDAPTITAVADQSINEDNPTGAIDFTVGDVDNVAGDLTVTGTSSNTTLVPNANVVIGGSGANRTVTVSPAANQNGTATITLTVSDGALTVTETFNITVAAVNDSPTIDAIANQTVFENSTPTVTVAVQDVDGDNVSISGVSDDSDRLINSNITDQTGSGASRTIQIELEKNVTGAVNVTLTASDGNGGSSSKSFAITIQANSNNAPVVNFSSEINQINDELDQIYYPFSLAVSDPDGDSVSIKLEQLDGFSWVNLVGGGGSVITAYSGHSVGDNLRVKVTSSAHGFSSSDRIKISGYGGSQTYNGVHDIEVIDSNNFYLEQVNYVDDDPTKGLVNLYGVVNAGANSDPSSWGSGVGIVPGNEDGDKIRVGRNLVNFRITVIDSPSGGGGSITVTKDASIFIVGKNDFPSIDGIFTSSIDLSDDIARGFIDFPASGALRDTNKASLVAKGLLDASHQVIYPFRNITITDSDITQEQDLIISSSNYNLGKFGFGSPTDAILNNKKYKLDSSLVGNDYSTDYGFLVEADHDGDGNIDGVKFPSQIEVDAGVSMNASELQSRVRNVWFYPTANINPITNVSSLQFNVRVEDNLGLFKEATTSLNIQSINISPEVTYSGEAFPSDKQRFVLNADDIKPFSEIAVSDADGTGVGINAKITVDDVNKGSLSNGGTNISWPVQFTGTASAMNTWFDGLVFTPTAYSQNPDNFSDHPIFTLEIDDGVATTTKILNISFDNTSKNYLVTNTNDSGVGSLRNAVNAASSGDVITFALSNYLSTIRLNSTIDLNKNLTIKGPGANLLRISGDSNGDGNPDVKIFNVSRVVSIDGVHFIDAKSTAGGALSVSSDGELYVTGCEFTNCIAEEWGGAIDVFNGKLIADSCLFYNNSVSASSGRGGGAVSIYSNKDAKFFKYHFFR